MVSVLPSGGCCVWRLAVLDVVLSLSVVVGPAGGEERVHFPDPTLKAAVEDALWIVDPTPSDMLALVELSYIPDESLHETMICDLAGLEYALNLQRLDLRLNRIGDLTPLSGLTNLETVDLSCNQVRDLTPLSGLSLLRSVDLHQNRISALWALAGLGNMERLILRFNEIGDLTPLASLTRLRELDLQANHVSDISPLCALRSLRNVDLRSNPLSWESYEIHMPCISAGNPGVCITCDPPSVSGVLHVDDDAVGDCGPADPTVSDPKEDGTLEHPFDCIQEAIEAANPETLILVHPGTYQENIACTGKGIRLMGAYSNTGAGLLFPVIEGIHDGPVVRLGGQEDRKCLLTRFVITAGRSEGTATILCDETTATIANCLIVGNRMTGPNAAVVYGIDSDLLIVNCTIADNRGKAGTAGIALVDSHLTMANSILWNDTPEEIVSFGSTALDVCYCAIRGSWPGRGNIDRVPQFARCGIWIDPDESNSALNLQKTAPAACVAGDYHLKSCIGRWDPDASTWIRDAIASPCIDGGNPGDPVADEPIPNGGIVNIGAYGGTVEASKSCVVSPEAWERHGL